MRPVVGPAEADAPKLAQKITRRRERPEPIRYGLPQKLQLGRPAQPSFGPGFSPICFTTASR